MSGKLFIVLFAVFLVSVNAFVKRDTPTTGGDTNYLENFQKQIQDLSKNITEALKPEQIQKSVSDAVDNLQKMLNDLKEKTNQPAAKP